MVNMYKFFKSHRMEYYVATEKEICFWQGKM